MTKLLIRLAGLLGLASLLLLTGCATSADVPALLSQPLDSTIQRQVTRQLGVRRLKVKGNVTVQLGNGNTNTDANRARGPVATGSSQAQDNTKAGQHGGAVTTAPGSSSGATTRTGVPPWLLGVGIGALMLLVLAGVVYRYRRGLVALLA